MAKKQTKPCSIGCYSECSEKCAYYQNNECSYVELLEQYRGRCCIGCDNGWSGHIVVLNPNTMQLVHIEPFPDAKRLYQVFEEFTPLYTVIEQVFMAPGFKGVASSNFEIMGRYKQVFEMLNLEYDCVRAVSWRAKLGIKAKGRPAQKAASIAKAKELFSPEEFDRLCTDYTRIDKTLHKKVTERWPDDNKCESALIAYYAAMVWKEKQAK